eukprot:gene4008-19321_t
MAHAPRPGAGVGGAATLREAGVTRHADTAGADTAGAA